MCKHLYIILTCVILVHSGIAQDVEAKELDSLQLAVTKAKQDTDKIKILPAIVNYYLNEDLDSALHYSEKMLKDATVAKWDRGINDAHYTLGVVYGYMGQYNDALKNYNSSLEYYKQSSDTTKLINTYYNMAVVCGTTYQYATALEYYFKVLKLSRLADNKQYQLLSLINIAGIYSLIGEIQKSMDYYKRALEINKELGLESYQAIILMNIAVLYGEEKNYKKAVEYNDKAIALFEKGEEYFRIANIVQNKAGLYQEQGKYSEAMDAYLESEKVFREYGETDYVVDNLLTTATLHYDIATDTTGFKPDGKTIPAGRDKNLQLAMSKAKEAKAFFDNGELEDILLLQYTYEVMAGLYEEMGRPAEALESYKQYMKLGDSLLAQEDDKRIAELEGRREVADREAKLELQEQLLTKKRNERWYMIGGIAFLVVVLIIIFRNYTERGRVNKLLNIEKQKSEELLQNILPEEVASELKERGATTAQHFDKVTVIFTDFVGFTKAGERMSSEELVEELHACFKAFDGITERYNIEKIKTIGDAYLAVCGLPVAVENHAENTVKAAVEILHFMKERQWELGDKTFKIRIGIHSGDVVAGIVGVKKFAYDIWGDTVNTAARMEQNSEPNRINISETTHQLIEDQFVCTYRGELEAKNKGKLKMYFVEA